MDRVGDVLLTGAVLALSRSICHSHPGHKTVLLTHVDVSLFITDLLENYIRFIYSQFVPYNHLNTSIVTK